VIVDTSFEAGTICVASMRVEHAKTSERVQVLVEHFALLVGQLLEAGKRSVDGVVVRQVDAELDEP